MVIDSVSPLAKSLPKVASRARRWLAYQQRIERSTMWMPVADSGPAGFTVFENRHYHAAVQELSWLKCLPAAAVAEFSGSKSLAHFDHRGSKAARADAELDARLSHRRDSSVRIGRVVHNGFSQIRGVPLRGRHDLTRMVSCGVQRITASISR